jgi:hypothetical protein
MDRKKIEITDFKFRCAGYGHYQVTYRSPKTGAEFTTVTDNMPLIDKTRNSENPKQKDLTTLKKLCKKQ